MARIAAIVPAYNEEATIVSVLEVLCSTPEIDEVIVVDDGSSDATAALARSVSGVRVISQRNQGKGAAMRAGAEATYADILFFSDADLRDLTSFHVQSILREVVEGRAAMSVGILYRGRFVTWWARHVAPKLGGERALERDLFLDIAEHAPTNFGIETSMNHYCAQHRLVVHYVVLKGITHVIKEEKYGVIEGVRARARMIREIFAAVMRRF